MKPKRIALDKLVDVTSAGYKALTTEERPVTPELTSGEPSITPQLKSLSETLMKEVKVPREQVTPDGKKMITMESVLPFGIGPDLLKSWPHLLKLSDLPDAKRISQLYQSLEPHVARSLPVEAFCYAANISPMRVLEILTGILVRQGAQASTILAAIWHPRVVEKTIQMALQDEGSADRATLHKATNFTPSPKGSQTIINVQQNAQNAPVVAFVPAPSPEATIRSLADTFNEARVGVPLLTQPAIDVDILDEDEEES